MIKFSFIYHHLKDISLKDMILNIEGFLFVASNFELSTTSYLREMKTKLSKIYGQKPYRTIQITR